MCTPSAAISTTTPTRMMKGKPRFKVLNCRDACVSCKFSRAMRPAIANLIKDKLRHCFDNADFTLMIKGHELRLAKRMARLGTETAFEVVVVPGGKPIIFFSVLALAEADDEVIYPNPGFPIYESMINYVGAKAVPIRLREKLDFRLDVDELADLINDRTKLIILNSPQNPTGGVLEKKDIDS